MDESKKQQVLDCADKIIEKCNELAKFEKNDCGKFVDEKESEKLKGIKGVYLFASVDNTGNIKKIVRVGTHTSDGENSLINRLRNHFNNNKDSSSFRKDISKCEGYENSEKISEYIGAFKILIIEENDKTKREEIERKLIATLSWAGFFSEKYRETDEVMKKSDNEFTRNYGLWVENEMFKEPILDINEVEEIFAKGIR